MKCLASPPSYFETSNDAKLRCTLEVALHRIGSFALTVKSEIYFRVAPVTSLMVMVRNPGSQRVNSMIVRVVADFRDEKKIVVLELGDVGIVIHEHAL